MELGPERSKTLGEIFDEAVKASLKRLSLKERVSFEKDFVLLDRLEYDGYLGMGLQSLGLPPGTAVECKVTGQAFTHSPLFEAFCDPDKLPGKLLFAFVLFDLSEGGKRSIQMRGNGHVRIAEENDYITLIRAYPDMWEPLRGIDKTRSRIPEYIERAACEEKAANQYGDAAENLKDHIAKIKESSNTRKISLILGNGVSIPFGSDPWGKLTSNLTDYLTPFYIENIDKVRNTIGNNFYASTSLAKHILSERGKYLDAIYYSIYRKYHDSYHNVDSLIKTIAKLVLKCHRFVEVGTFNYDSFLENAINKEKGHLEVRSVFGYDLHSAGIYVPIQIFHLHGYIPSDISRASKKEMEEYRDSIVLTQEDYFECYSDENSFTYRKQLELYKNEICLFVGSSMTDVFQLQCMRKSEKRPFYAILAFDKDLPKEKDRYELSRFYERQNIIVLDVEKYSEIDGLLNYLFGI